MTIHPDRIADLAATSPGDPRDLAATQIIRGLIRFAYLPGLIRYAAEGPATAWGAAKISLDAATDLLTTYRNLEGAIRTPDAIEHVQRFTPDAGAKIEHPLPWSARPGCYLAAW